MATHTTTVAETQAYAAATNDSNPVYQKGDIAPPMYAVFLEMPPLMAAVKSPEVIGDPARFKRLLHGEHDMRWHQPIAPNQTYSTEVSVANRATKPSGEVINLRIETKDSKGALAVETISSMFIRAEQKSAGGGAQLAAATSTSPTPLFTVQETVAPDQSVRYAAASGDHNPIHTDREVAKKAGLPDIILHGLCTMAFVQKAVVNNLCGGDPRRLRRLKVRFTKPVLMGQTLTITGWKIEPRVFGLDCSVDGAPVLKDAVAEVND